MSAFLFNDKINAVSDTIERLEVMSSSTLKPFLSFFQSIEKSLDELKIDKEELKSTFTLSIQDKLKELEQAAITELSVGDVVWAKYPLYGASAAKNKWFLAKVKDFHYESVQNVVTNHPKRNQKKKHQQKYTNSIQLVATLDFGEGYTSSAVIEEDIRTTPFDGSEVIGQWCTSLNQQECDVVSFPMNVEVSHKVGDTVVIKTTGQKAVIDKIEASELYHIQTDQNSENYYAVSKDMIKPVDDSKNSASGNCYERGLRVDLRYPSWQISYRGTIKALMKQLFFTVHLSDSENGSSSDSSTDTLELTISDILAEGETIDEHLSKKQKRNTVLKFKVGDEVEGNYQMIGLWYGAVISKVIESDNGTCRYDLKYKDGDSELAVRQCAVRIPELVFKVGDRVEAKRADKLYYQCEIISISEDGSTCDVKYSDKYTFSQKVEKDVFIWKLRVHNKISESLIIANNKKKTKSESKDVKGPSIDFSKQFTMPQ